MVRPQEPAKLPYYLAFPLTQGKLNRWKWLDGARCCDGTIYLSSLNVYERQLLAQIKVFCIKVSILAQACELNSLEFSGK